MKLRAVVFGALVIAATVAVPAAAEEGIHVSKGATDSWGCYAIEVWDGDVLVRTIPASMDNSTKVCTTLARTAFLPSGILLFELRHGPDVRYAGGTEVWASDGTTDGTVELGSYPNQGRQGTDICDGALQIVGPSAYISGSAATAASATSIVATRGTPASTWTLPGALQHTYPRVPYIVLHDRILYTATDSTNGRDLVVVWASDGTRDGTVQLGSYPLPGRQGGDTCDGALQVVGPSAYISWYCGSTGAHIVATRGTPASTWTLPGPLAGAWPAYGVLHDRIFYGATDTTKGRELWVSNGTRPSTHVVRDIRPGARGSSPRSCHRTAPVSGSPRTTAPGGDGG